MKLKIPKQCSCVNCRSYYDQKNHHFYQNKIRTGNRRRFRRLFRKLNKQSKDYESIKLPNIEQYSD